MKYLYFDCFAGFDVFMALGAVADMLGCTDEAQKMIKKLDSAASLSFSEVKRAGMESCLAQLTLAPDNSEVTFSYFTDKIDSLEICDNTKKILGKFIKIKSEAMAVNPEEAKFSLSGELAEIYAVAIFGELLSNQNISGIYCSDVHISDGVIFTDNGFEPVTTPETGYIAKKYNINTAPCVTGKEIFNEGGAAMLGALGAVSSCVSGTVLKIGYGAGESELETLPNILRAVLGEEGEFEGLNFEAENLMLEFSQEVSLI